MALITKVLDNNTLVGIFGTTLSILLENISIVASIFVALLTAGYMATRWYNEYHRGIIERENSNNDNNG